MTLKTNLGEETSTGQFERMKNYCCCIWIRAAQLDIRTVHCKHVMYLLLLVYTVN